MAQKIQAVRGMNDLLPAQISHWQRVEAVLREVSRAYGYEEIRTPVVEKAELFTQSIGGVTDIVEKEMYVFTDSGDAQLALRPEATASTVRACIQHSLLYAGPRRLWYMGPMFRRERPQKGRYRQFHQFGVEAFGWHGASIDAEVIRLSAQIWRRLGIDMGARDAKTGLRLQLNTLGSPEIGANYRRALHAYFSRYADQLDADSVRRLQVNPLRILDSKTASMQDLIAAAPRIQEFLDADARANFDELCAALQSSGIGFEVNPHLVRGLDYYTSTVFEWVVGDRAQNAVCAGGRYDDLVAARGGTATPAVGFALGLERLVELVADADAETAGWRYDVYVAAEGSAAQSVGVEIAEALRGAGFTVITHHGGGRLKKQLKAADASGARIAALVGFDAQHAKLQVKWLRENNPQQTVNLDAVVDWCKSQLR